MRVILPSSHMRVEIDKDMNESDELSHVFVNNDADNIRYCLRE
jgi:hypothetical protein